MCQYGSALLLYRKKSQGFRDSRSKFESQFCHLTDLNKNKLLKLSKPQFPYPQNVGLLTAALEDECREMGGGVSRW